MLFGSAGTIIPGVLIVADVQTIESARRLGDARAVSRLLGCSWRTVYRLADSGRIPTGFKLGVLRRWDLSEIDAFIEGGCKPVRGGRA
jgi:excisionase family DNA binding protein